MRSRLRGCEPPRKLHLRVCTSLLVAAFFLVPTPAAGNSLPASLVQGLKPAINTQVSAARRVARELGVVVTELDSGQEVYSYQGDVPRILASNTKLFTTGAALDLLGPGFFFETPMLLRGAVAEGRLQGDLAIVGGGDPNISGRHYFGDSFGVFRRWAAALRARGIRRVEGDLYLVDGLFDDQRVHPDWPKDQLTRWYEAPVDSLSFNDNSVLVRVWPGERAGRPVRVEVEPPLRLFQVEVQAVTSSSRRAGVRIDRRLGTNVLTVAGGLHPGRGPVEKWVAVEDPVQYFAAALEAALQDGGIDLQGRIYRASELPGSGWQMASVHRTDLLTTLEVINKRSQNFYAESLLKLLGARHCDAGDWAGGIRVVEEFLDRLGLDRSGLQLADGSGMSRGNRSSPRLVTEFLERMFAHERSREYLRTLPYSGEPELSWRKRLASPPYRGNVFAKTGTLSGVSTLSGFARASSGRTYAFSILCNRTRSAWEARRAQDRILKALIDNG